MTSRQIVMTIDEDEQASFFLCLVLGTLYAVKEGALSPDIGIWALGRPIMSELLAEFPTTSPKVLQALSVSDELSALQKLRPDELDRLLNELLNDLMDELRSISQPMWHIDVRITPNDLELNNQA